MFSNIDRKNIIARLEEIVGPILQDSGFELVEIEVGARGRKAIIRIFMDSEDGVTIDDCTRMSEEIGVNLEATNPISESYVLEISSPGLDRPLTKERDFRRSIGDKIHLILKQPLDGEKELLGKLEAIENGIIKITYGKNKSFEISLGDIEKAKLRF